MVAVHEEIGYVGVDDGRAQTRERDLRVRGQGHPLGGPDLARRHSLTETTQPPGTGLGGEQGESVSGSAADYSRKVRDGEPVGIDDHEVPDAESGQVLDE